MIIIPILTIRLPLVKKFFRYSKIENSVTEDSCAGAGLNIGSFFGMIFSVFAEDSFSDAGLNIGSFSGMIIFSAGAKGDDAFGGIGGGVAGCLTISSLGGDDSETLMVFVLFCKSLICFSACSSRFFNFRTNLVKKTMANRLMTDPRQNAPIIKRMISIKYISFYLNLL